jgi:Restriction endonuclease
MLRDAIEEPNKVRKGKMFESFFENFMDQQQGFVYIEKHCRSRVGEVDYFYRADTRDHPLWERYPFLFIECKNWIEPISSEKMDHFIRLVIPKQVLSCCGVYVTTSSFSPESLITVRDAIVKNEIMIILIDKNDLSDLIDQGFKDFVQTKSEKVLARV